MFAEVLAASGAAGVVPFIIYIFVLIRQPLSLGRKSSTATRVVLSGLTWALCMELIILQFNQNVLRAYLWFHIGALSAAYCAVKNDAWEAQGSA